eukprot:2761183-Pyramimonas_sp.AAC.1
MPAAKSSRVLRSSNFVDAEDTEERTPASTVATVSNNSTSIAPLLPTVDLRSVKARMRALMALALAFSSGAPPPITAQGSAARASASATHRPATREDTSGTVSAP